MILPISPLLINIYLLPTLELLEYSNSGGHLFSSFISYISFFVYGKIDREVNLTLNIKENKSILRQKISPLLLNTDDTIANITNTTLYYKNNTCETYCIQKRTLR